MRLTVETFLKHTYPFHNEATMSKIVLMAPGGNIAKHAYKLQETLGNKKNFHIVHGYMEGAVAYAKKYLDENVDVIIARGNTAKLMKAAKLRFPIVTIPISNTEIINSIRKARESCRSADSRIGYIGLEDAIQGVQEFLEVMNYKVSFYPVNSSRDLREQVIKAKNEGVDVVIGGTQTQQYAREQGIAGVLLETSLYSITQAYEHAREVQRSVLLHKKKLEEQNTLIDSISEGVVGISEKGRITLCNSRARHFLRTEERLLRGERIEAVFKQTETELIRAVLNGGSAAANHAFDIQGAEYELDLTPVLVHKKSKGVIATIRKKGRPTDAARTTAGAFRGKTRATRFSDLIGESLAFQLTVSAAKSYAGLDAPLIISGEFGVGKETFASCIHHAGPRSSGGFIARRADSLTEEDLFAAHQGTLYIDEISELTPDACRLVLDLADRGIVRTRRNETRNANVRIIAGTMKNLADLTERNRFDQKLYYALNSFILGIPSLAEREEDAPLLFEHFLGSYRRESGTHARVDASVYPVLREHRWRGNLRELENLCRRLAALTKEDASLTGADIEKELGDARYYSHPPRDAEPAVLSRAASAAAEKSLIINRRKYTFDDLRALDSYYSGKRNLLAEKLGISRSTLWRYFRLMEETTADRES